MSFLFKSQSKVRPQERPVAEAPRPSTAPNPIAESFYRELIEQRPALIDEKLRIHSRIIDEFNLAMLEKMPREEMVRQIRTYVGNYVRSERISLNQRELDEFANEIID